MPEPVTTSRARPLDLRIYLGMILLRWQVIVVCLLYGLLVGVIIVQVTTKKYVVKCNIRSFVDSRLKVEGYRSAWASIERNMLILRGGFARNEAVRKLTPKWGKILASPKELWLNLSLRPKGVRDLEVSVHCSNPDFGVAFLTAVMEAHKQQMASGRVDSDSASERMLQEELAHLEELIKSAEDEVLEFRRLHDLRRTSIRGGMEERTIQDLIARRYRLETEMWMMEVAFPELHEENVAVISGIREFLGKVRQPAEGQPAEGTAGEAVPGGADAGALTPGLDTVLGTGQDESLVLRRQELGWVKDRRQLEALKEQEQSMMADLKPDHPNLQAVRKQIAVIEGRLKNAAELELLGFRDRYRQLKIAHASVEAAEFRWQAKDSQQMRRYNELGQLNARVKRLESSHSQLYSRLQDLRLTRDIDADRFEYSPPRSSTTPIWPDTRKILLFSVGIGLGLGVAMGLAAQVLDNKVQSIKDVEELLGLPFLGGLPFWAHSGLERTIRPIVTEEHSSGAVEAYRSLRTTVLAAMARENEKILLVTSADSREGKTLTALNLSILISQMGKRVLLVDMDLRRGRLHRSLGLEKEPGVSDVLGDRANLKDVIVSTRIPNLDLAPPGKSIEEAPELLQSTGVDSIFVDVEDEYDYIIVDTSPVLRVTDSVIVASQGYGVVLLVARVNHTPKPLIRYALDMLKDARIIGMVLNSIEMHRISSLYYAYQYPNYAYYSNAYSYGYSYAYYGDMADEEKRFRRRGGGLKTGMQSLSKWARETFLPME